MKVGTGAGPLGDRSWRARLSPKPARFSCSAFLSRVSLGGAVLGLQGGASQGRIFFFFFPGALLSGDKVG